MKQHRLVSAALAAALAASLSCGQKPPDYVPTRPLLDGLSAHHMEITTQSPVAQQYFDQGLRLVYAFNHAEAIRAFEEGHKVDPDCAMCWWGIALALGPNINAPMDASAVTPANEALAKALERAPKASAREQAYIQALSARYSDKPDADRAALDKAYADAMRDVAAKHPNDLDATTLFAESLMDLTPWAYWTKTSEANQYTAEIVAQLERVLVADPNHPGANHYYIHAVEASNEPGKALPSAKRLETLAPTAGHLVHMSAHTYMRVGQYHDASLANERGATADEEYAAWCKSGGFYMQAYYPHNLHFLWASQMFEGRSNASLGSAQKLAAQITDDAARAMPPAHELYAVRYFAPVRFGKWDQILAAPAPPEDLEYARGIYHWARGMAFAETDKQAEAEAELAALTALASDESVVKLEFLQGSAAQQLGVATHVLTAHLAGKKGDHDKAVAELAVAREKEYALRYTEPPPWPIPVRHYQGQALLDAGRPAEAEAVYLADLAEFPENGFALHGLIDSLRAQNKPTDEAEARFAAAWSRGDVKLESSRF